MTNLVPIPSADPVVRRPLDDLRRIIYVPVCLTDVQAFQVLNRKDGAGRKIDCAIPYGDAIPSSVSRHSWISHFSGVRCFYIGYLFCGYDVYPAAPVRRKYDNLFKYKVSYCPTPPRRSSQNALLVLSQVVQASRHSTSNGRISKFSKASKIYATIQIISNDHIAS